MLYPFLANCGPWGERPGICRGGAVVTFGQLAEMARGLSSRLVDLAGRPVGLALEPGDGWLAAAAALDGLACRTFLFPGTMPAEEIERLAEAFGLGVVLHDRRELGSGGRFVALPGTGAGAGPAVDAAADDGPAREGSVVLFTSGTTGQPKAAVHTWASLASGVKRSDKLLDARMLLTYDPTRYAGLQVLLTALLNGACLVVPASRSIADAIDAAVRQRVDFVSATPTFWRMLLATATDEQRQGMPLRQITLGGEAIAQPILDALRCAWPAARITHIYASTEMGVCFSVHDGRAGFPADFLNNNALPVRLKIQAGRLMVCSSRAMAGYLAGAGGTEMPAEQWFDTGDAVEVRGGRVFFLGRESGRINVGGEKVYPEEIESAIRQVPGVADCRVSGVDSSIVGQLVQAEIVAAPGAEPDDVRRRVIEFCRERLAGYKQPRIIRLVASVTGADGTKVARRRGR